MSEPLRGVVVCHGALAQALVSAVEQITGLTGRFVPVSNTDCDRDGLERRIADAIGGAPAVVFVDMASGSCLFAALHRLRDEPNVKVVTGVNLPMLLDFLNNRALPPGDGVVRAAEKGADAIRKG